ncbi:gluconokinase [Nocardioides sp.]|uniref:gluconokinase n=1 Tax=Nocardioides sp. TaxID=35761 RepID=UPI002732DAC3|nr:gluconokinase [Nocardioides sp.]MDP3894989.1 gluconokinase [Nocardioides sp.]
MGVSGTGKTSVGQRIAALLGGEFLEGDSFHPESNIAKMSAGIPLTDEDRWPWLETLAGLVGSWDIEGVPTVLTCSALRRRYRDVLRTAVPEPRLVFVHLHASFEVLEARMQTRADHFMPASLLRSQFETLEPLEPDETGFVIDVSATLDDVLAAAVVAVAPPGTDPSGQDSA